MRNFIEQVDLVHAVDRDQADAVIQRLLQLRPILVVAVEIEVTGREIGGTHDSEFAAGDNIDTDMFFLKNFRQRRIRERLGRVRNVGIRILGLESVHKFPTHRANRVLVVHVERSTVHLCERYGIAAADSEMPGVICAGGHRQKVQIRNLGHGSPFIPLLFTPGILQKRDPASAPRQVHHIDGRNGKRTASTSCVTRIRLPTPATILRSCLQRLTLKRVFFCW